MYLTTATEEYYTSATRLTLIQYGGVALYLPRYRKATVQIIYYHSSRRRRDPQDNYAPKFLMDALVAGGVLSDDSGELVNVLPVVMEVDRERPRTEVFIWQERFRDYGAEPLM